eukprot:NODE_468_length_8097_cov_0.251813.p3 type:complete len:338 gc:universal NODE_468_length_8097_cov_0.251813:5009-3996(-)
MSSLNDDNMLSTLPWATAMVAVKCYANGEGIPDSIENISTLFNPEILEQDFDGFMKCLRMFLNIVMETFLFKTNSVVDDNKFLMKVIETWTSFYSKTLPFLQMILSPVDEILENDKVRVLALQTFSSVVIMENKLRLYDLFTSRKTELLNDIDNSQLVGKLNQMLTITCDALTKRLNILDDPQSLVYDIGISTRRASTVLDVNKKSKTSSNNSRRSSVTRSRSNTTLKGLFKQNSSHLASPVEKLSKSSSLRKSSTTGDKDILDIKDEFDKNWMPHPTPAANIDILIYRKTIQMESEEDISLNVIDHSIREYSSKDLTMIEPLSPLKSIGRIKSLEL